MPLLSLCRTFSRFPGHVLKRRLHIGRNVLIALQGELFLPVVIKDDVWIGSGARILAGISLSTGVVVGANSVVTHSFEPFSVVYGAPARLYRYRCTAEDLPSVGLSI